MTKKALDHKIKGVDYQPKVYGQVLINYCIKYLICTLKAPKIRILPCFFKEDKLIKY